MEQTQLLVCETSRSYGHRDQQLSTHKSWDAASRDMRHDKKDGTFIHPNDNGGQFESMNVTNV